MSRRFESLVIPTAYVGDLAAGRRVGRYASPREDLHRNSPPVHPGSPGPVAGPSLARAPRHRARDAGDGAPPTRPARHHGAGPGPDAPQPSDRLRGRRLGPPDLWQAQVLRLGWLARRPPD